MGQTVNLLEAVKSLDSHDHESTIYATAPWNAESRVVIVEPPEAGGLPNEAESICAEYFLEVFIAKEFLEDWRLSLNGRPTAEQECARVIQYAINDA